MRPWAVPAALSAVAAMAAVGAVAYQPSASVSGAKVTGLAEPVLSARRLPAAMTALVADDRLSARLEAVLGDPALGPTRDASCMEVRVGDQVVYGHHPTAARLPASNAKLLTAAAALTRLGADSHLTTNAVAVHRPVNGVLDGPLWLVGGGDPLLITAGYRASQTEFTWSSEPGSHLEDLADRIRAAGVKVINGGVIGDDSRYDSLRAIPTWKPSYLADGEIGAVGALVVNGGFESLTRRVPARSPATAAAAALTALLQQRGISVNGATGQGRSPAGTSTVASLDSLPLGQIVQVMLLESDNLSAETLVKELGYRFGPGGTWPSGLAVLRSTLAQSGLSLSGLTLVDGSGLDRSDRASCDLLAMAVTGSGPVAAAIDAGLPIAARNGTLVHRLLGQPAAGRLRAKTGSLAGVGALTGLIEPVAASGAAGSVPGASGSAGSAPAFALLANDLPTDAAARALEDRIADVMASYPEAPSPATLVP